MKDSNSNVISWKNFNSNFKDFYKSEPSTLEEILNHLSKQGKAIEWIDFKSWESLEDIEIFREFPNLEKISGDVYITTEASYKKELGPFKIHSNKLEKFIRGHLNAYGECFFNGDVIIVNPENECMWFFHHSGLMTFVARSPLS